MAAHKVGWARLNELDGCDDHEHCEAAGRQVDAALAALLATPPTTPASARAAIAWLVEFDKGQSAGDERRLHADAAALADLRRLIRLPEQYQKGAAFGLPFSFRGL